MTKIVISIFMFLIGSQLVAQKSSNTGVLGDYDGNGKKEYAYVKVKDCDDDCSGKCETTVFFSDKNIKPFIISPAKGGSLFNLKDLNNDGKDDLGFYPDWCTSCWHPFYVYTLTGQSWKPLVEPISTHCNQWEEDKFPIRKDPKKKGNVIITTSKWEEDDIKIISKSIKIN